MNTFTDSSSILVKTLRFSVCSVIKSANSDRFFFFFFLSNWMHFIYFSCLIAVERTSNTMLNRCDESGHSHLIPDFREKPSSFCNQDVSCDFVINNLYIAEIYSFYTNFDKSLFLIMNG